jgi:uncharacterized protein
MKKEEILIPAKEGKNINGILTIPEFPNKIPAVVICHGFLENKNREFIIEIARSLSYAGFVTLSFDFQASAEQDGSKEATITQRIEDIKTCLTYVSARLEVDPEKVVVLGHGLGAMVSMFVKHKHLKALVSIAARNNMNEFIDSYFSRNDKQEWKRTGVLDYLNTRLKLTFWEDLREYDLEGRITELELPILVLHGSDDKRFPFTEAKEIAFACKDFSTLYIIDGADHNFTNPEQRQELFDTIINWLRRILSK